MGNLEPLLIEIVPQKKRTRPSNWSKRDILDGIFYQLKNGCNWEDLPCIPTALFDRLLALAFSGVKRAQSRHSWVIYMNKCGNKWKKSQMDNIDHHWLHLQCRIPAMRVSSQKDECFYKATNGIKRHLAVDTLGFPFFTHCTRANVSDDAGLPIDVDAKHCLLPVEADEHS